MGRLHRTVSESTWESDKRKNMGQTIASCSLLKMTMHQLCHMARDGPINATFSGRTTNDTAQNIIRLKNAICTETLTITFHMLMSLLRSLFWAKSCFTFYHSVDGLHPLHWLVQRVRCGKGDARAFLAASVFANMYAFPRYLKISWLSRLQKHAPDQCELTRPRMATKSRSCLDQNA